MFALPATPTDARVLPVLIAGMPLPFEMPRPGTIPIPPQPEGRIVEINDGDDDEEGDETDDAPAPRPVYRRMPYLN